MVAFRLVFSKSIGEIMTDDTNTRAGLLACPWCNMQMMFRKALWSSDGNVDSIIHAAPTKCPMSVFEDGSTDETIIGKWNTRAAQSAQGEPTREALDNSQSLLVMIYQLNTNGSVSEHDWETEGLAGLITKQIAENRAALSATQGRDADSALRPADGGRISEEGLMEGTFFELPDGQVVCFNPTGRWHGWLFRRHADCSLVSVRKLGLASLPLPTLPQPQIGKDQP
jgi:hypothetical protein